MSLSFFFRIRRFFWVVLGASLPILLLLAEFQPSVSWNS